MIKKIPMRTCAVTKEKVCKSELVRIVRTPEGEIKIDLTGKMNGKGCYLSKNKDIINKAKQTKIIEKYLEKSISDSVYDELLDIVSE